ncbi:hypothetical protein PCANC_02347 [Puccinia coronata f. sp. avenae]|uniref:Uncharacterized protein n=1 Tax=Puccinia coronata f. sp. avenae TaxID=200324 RepID=A0A2N5VZM7_9BASI|nr:hypothetical protein PCANC_02347 [Puccinia coronata f. sp. avenae]
MVYAIQPDLGLACLDTSGVFYVANSENNGNSAPHDSNTIGDSQNFTRQGYYEFTQNQFVSGFNHGTSGLNNANGPLGNGAQPAALPGDHPAAATLSGTPPAAAVLPVVHPAITVLPGAHPAATTLLPGGHPAASVLPVGHTAATPLPGVHPTATGNTQPAQHGNSVQSAPSQKTTKKRGPHKKRKHQSSTGPSNRPSVPILSSGPANATASPTLGSNNDSGTDTRTNNQTPNPTLTGVTTCTNSEPRQTGNRVTQSFQDADHHVIRVVQSATCKNKQITNSVKDELRLIMLDYQKQVQLVALRSQICAELLFKWLGVYNKSRTPNQFNNFCRYSPDARKLFGLKEFPPSERMQQVGELWRELCKEDQLKFCDWDFINDLRLQMGLEPLDDPEALEPEDESEEIDADQEHPRNPPTANGPKDNVPLPISKKSNYEAESSCDKWVNKAVRDFNHFSSAHRVEGFFFAMLYRS